ncbi:MAG: hypothetical protein NTX61_18995 [Bacteroidetes bacterium]|nr:hypothetical protein [Bacteroidota bacterium]
MKTMKLFAVLGILLFATIIFESGCKKKTTTITPAFGVSATPVTLDIGPGLDFFATCTNDDVKMTKVTIYAPLNSSTYEFNLNGTYFLKNQIIALQADLTGYLKVSGIWTFSFVGNRTADGASFSTTATVNVSAK